MDLPELAKLSRGGLSLAEARLRLSMQDHTIRQTIDHIHSQYPIRGDSPRLSRRILHTKLLSLHLVLLGWRFFHWQ